MIADGADGIDWAANCQFNLYNVFAYHNFGVFEPNVPLLAMANYTGYIEQAGQSVPKGEHATDTSQIFNQKDNITLTE